MSTTPEIPTTIEELWDVAFVAENEDQAREQMYRQFEPFDGKVIAVRHLFGKIDDGLTEIDLREPAQFIVVGMWDVYWEADCLIPEWKLRPVDPDAAVETARDQVVRLGDIEDVSYFAPGIGTQAGFGKDKARFILPLPDRNG